MSSPSSSAVRTRVRAVCLLSALSACATTRATPPRPALPTTLAAQTTFSDALAQAAEQTLAEARTRYRADAGGPLRELLGPDASDADALDASFAPELPVSNGLMGTLTLTDRRGAEKEERAVEGVHVGPGDDAVGDRPRAACLAACPPATLGRAASRVRL